MHKKLKLYAHPEESNAIAEYGTPRRGGDDRRRNAMASKNERRAGDLMSPESVAMSAMLGFLVASAIVGTIAGLLGTVMGAV